MLHNVGGGVKVGLGPMWAKQVQESFSTRVVTAWSQKKTYCFISSKLVHDWKYIFSIFMCLGPWRSTSIWSLSTQTCKLNLIVLFGHQGCTEAFTARMCIIPLCCATNTIICSVILCWVSECFSSLLKLSCLTQFMMLCFSELHLTKVYVLNYMSSHPKILSSW